MTVDEIRDHADRLQGRLEAERKKMARGEYAPTAANQVLIGALEGRITELLAQCDATEAVPSREGEPVLLTA